jgi:hypothetical protein
MKCDKNLEKMYIYVCIYIHVCIYILLFIASRLQYGTHVKTFLSVFAVSNKQTAGARNTDFFTETLRRCP